MRLTKEQRKQLYPSILKEFLSDSKITLMDLSKKHNVSYSSLYKFASENNIKIERRSERHLRGDEKVIKAVIEEYASDKTITANYLSEKYSISVPTITRWLKRNGIKPRRAKKIDDESFKKAAELYKEKHNIIQVSKEIGIGKHSLSKYFKDNNLLSKKVVVQNNICYNEDFFAQLNTEEKAYWFGFIYADGCIRYKPEENSGQLTIEISKNDVNMLKKFKDSIESNINIKYRQRKLKSGNISDTCSITISSVKMCKDLIKFGCVPNKTYNGQIKKELFSKNVSFKIAFLRGYLDGDGYISKDKNVYSLSYVIHNYKVMNFVLRSIIEVSNVIPTIRYETNDNFQGAYRLRITNKVDFFKFLDVIYKDPSIYMERKYKKYLLKKAV